jgi:hypothetical protein
MVKEKVFPYSNVSAVTQGLVHHRSIVTHKSGTDGPPRLAGQLAERSMRIIYALISE